MVETIVLRQISGFEEFVFLLWKPIFQIDYFCLCVYLFIFIFYLKHQEDPTIIKSLVYTHPRNERF